MSFNIPKWISDIYYKVDKNKNGITQDEIDNLDRTKAGIDAYIFEAGMDLNSFVYKNRSVFEGYINFDETSYMPSFTKENKITPERRQELEEWTLSYNFNIDRTNLESVETETEKNDTEKEEMIRNWHLEANKKEIFDIYNDWYQNYLKNNNYKEMNFITAMEYLKNNPNEKPEIKEFIKRCFGICDGEVTNNKQMGLGSCSLLSIRENMENNTQINGIAKNIVKQNDDGTVTVTFWGIKVKNKNGEYEPIQFTIKNEEIKDSYTNLNPQNSYYGGSTDPDSAALEIAYAKFKEFINEKYPIPNVGFKESSNVNVTERINEIKNFASELLEEISKNMSKLYLYLQDNAATLRDAKIAPHLLEAMDDVSNSDYYPVYSGLTSFIRKNPEQYMDEIQSLNIGLDTESLKNLIQKYANISDLLNRISEVDDLYNSENGIDEDVRYTTLTGLGNYIDTFSGKEDIDNYFKSINYDVNNKGIVAAKISEDKIPEMLYPHTYMVKEIYEDENGERYITFKNPHNRSYNEISTDKIVSGNPGNTFTLPYNYVINELNITTILEEPVKNKRQYYKIPDDFQFIP